MPNSSVIEDSRPSDDKDQTTRLTPMAVETFDERKLLAILNPVTRVDRPIVVRLAACRDSFEALAALMEPIRTSTPYNFDTQ